MEKDSSTNEHSCQDRATLVAVTSPCLHPSASLSFEDVCAHGRSCRSTNRRRYSNETGVPVDLIIIGDFV